VAAERTVGPSAGIGVQREKVLPIYSDDVTAVTLRREGKEIHCEKREKRWQVVRPEGAKAPADLVAALVENLTDRQEAEEMQVSPKPEDLAAFGLTDSSQTLEFQVTDGRKLVVKLGSRNPPQTAVYAQTSISPRVLLIGVNVQYYTDLLYEAGARAPAQKSGVV
jgi:hypothetical protein